MASVPSKSDFASFGSPSSSASRRPTSAGSRRGSVHDVGTREGSQFTAQWPGSQGDTSESPTSAAGSFGGTIKPKSSAASKPEGSMASFDTHLKQDTPNETLPETEYSDHQEDNSHQWGRGGWSAPDGKDKAVERAELDLERNSCQGTRLRLYKSRKWAGYRALTKESRRLGRSLTDLSERDASRDQQ